MYVEWVLDPSHKQHSPKDFTITHTSLQCQSWLKAAKLFAGTPGQRGAEHGVEHLSRSESLQSQKPFWCHCYRGQRELPSCQGHSQVSLCARLL